MNCLYEPMHKSHLSTAINYIILFFIYRQVYLCYELFFGPAAQKKAKQIIRQHPF